ncbi:hypothetical protein, partial [Endozoicomonas sp. ALB115]|uniref:hypothetical protein n=1 Tax=Endozoicomonas sp. ALB115 TaxID=3403074 RepID=UPI003BB69277
MISQPTIQPTGTATAPGSVTVQPGEGGNGGLWSRFKVAQYVLIPLLRSLHPDYNPPGLLQSAQGDEGPLFTIGSSDGQNSSFFQGVALGARLVSPYTVLPEEISTLLEGFVTLSTAARLRNLFGGSATASAPGQSRADSTVDGSPTNDKGKKKKKSQQTPQPTSPPATASARTGQLPNTALALGALASLTAVGGSSATTPAHTKTFAPTTEPRAACADDEFPCDNGECIHAGHQCDGEVDCADGSDENCTLADCDRLERNFFCDDNKRCVSADLRCDGKKNCGDGSDENCTQTDCDKLNRTFFCDDSRCIRTGWLCDGEAECDDLSDENCTLADCIKLGHNFLCDDNKKCVSDALQCDGDAECEDGSDENCTLADCDRLNRTFLCDDSRCISAGWQCDGYIDCDDGSDENCTLADCIERGHNFLCDDNECVTALICDGIDNCYDGSDERVELCNLVSSGLSGTTMAVPTSAAPQATVSNPAMNVSGLSGTSIMALPT